MKRLATLALATLAVTLLLAGAAMATKHLINCPGGDCAGTKRADEIFGTSGPSFIDGRGGDDRIFPDGVGGDSGNDLVGGGAGDDVIVDSVTAGPDKDQIFGGKGDDSIDVRERLGGGADFVDCGPGKDTVFLDLAVFDESDVAANCERVNPPV